MVNEVGKKQAFRMPYVFYISLWANSTARKFLLFAVIIQLFVLAEAQDAQENADSRTRRSIRAARSVHLAYQAPDAMLFYNEVTVERSQKGSYFSVCGFRHGYFGIQERNHDKVVIFSVWDPGKQDNPNAVKENQRVQLLYKDKDVTTGRFGGEGTGGQSFLEYNWKTGQTYRFLVAASLDGDRTEYAAYFYINELHQWKHLVTFSTITKGDTLKGYYSFIEDFRRDYTSVNEVRRARFGNGWVKTAQGHWVSLTKARFTADSTPLMNIDAGVTDEAFFLETGGETENHTELWSYVERPPNGLSLPETVVNDKN